MVSLNTVARALGPVVGRATGATGVVAGESVGFVGDFVSVVGNCVGEIVGCQVSTTRMARSTKCTIPLFARISRSKTLATPLTTIEVPVFEMAMGVSGFIVATMEDPSGILVDGRTAIKT